MGDIHESCLSKWVNMSRKKGCEICKTPYEKGGSKFRKISEWDKPEITKSNLLDILILLLIAYLLYYIMLLLHERKFFLKVQLKLALRPDDYGRLGYLLIFMLFFSMILLEQLMLVAAYFIKQREIYFVNRKTKSVLPAED
ncbi:hypothetical protein WR25_21126 [Diploscapter pachys]|uniref:RING-CH-type domain-containing protein n=1 Tax=Diploscapter pachys TaxID=2018661 RepID=A0A2A2KXL4_9BILA|nr:hypothetical protein WR25_21126 [Diploscapter pachys]